MMATPNFETSVDHLLRELTVTMRPVSELKPYEQNARTHSAKQIHQIAASISTFGFTVPVLIDGEDRIIAGHGRIAAARQIGLEYVPCIAIEDLTEDQKRAYVIADNRIAEQAGWDPDILKVELQHLTSVDLGFDVEVIGFETSEIDIVIDGGEVSDKGLEKVLGRSARRKKPDPADAVPEPELEEPTVTSEGDLWLMGGHRLLCGDATEPNAYDRLLAEGAFDLEAADLVFTDPPYNVPIAGHVSGLGKVTHREFAMASGEMTQEAFTAFLQSVFGQLVRVSKDGSIHFVCMDWRHMGEVLAASHGVFTELKNLCVWNKDNAGMGSLYRSKHELVFVFKAGTAAHINNVKLGSKGRYRSNVWDYAGVNSFSGRADLEMHPTVKPVGLIADAIRDCSRRGSLVLDPFGGSGSTLLAAERTKRAARLIEIDPHYCDTIIRRWEKHTGGTAVDARSGVSFAEMAERKRNAS
jgi:DNA modification methylase